MAAFLAAIVAFAQWNFTVDTTFQAEVEGKNINDLMVMPDGKSSSLAGSDFLATTSIAVVPSCWRMGLGI
jgi:hypothetical protein